MLTSLPSPPPCAHIRQPQGRGVPSTAQPRHEKKMEAKGKREKENTTTIQGCAAGSLPASPTTDLPLRSVRLGRTRAVHLIEWSKYIFGDEHDSEKGPSALGLSRELPWQQAKIQLRLAEPTNYCQRRRVAPSHSRRITTTYGDQPVPSSLLPSRLLGRGKLA